MMRRWSSGRLWTGTIELVICSREPPANPATVPTTPITPRRGESRNRDARLGGNAPRHGSATRPSPQRRAGAGRKALRARGKRTPKTLGVLRLATAGASRSLAARHQAKRPAFVTSGARTPRGLLKNGESPGETGSEAASQPGKTQREVGADPGRPSRAPPPHASMLTRARQTPADRSGGCFATGRSEKHQNLFQHETYRDAGASGSARESFGFTSLRSKPSLDERSDHDSLRAGRHPMASVAARFFASLRVDPALRQLSLCPSGRQLSRWPMRDTHSLQLYSAPPVVRGER